MKAAKTRAGGRHCAAERGAFDHDDRVSGAVPPATPDGGGRTAGGPLPIPFVPVRPIGFNFDRVLEILMVDPPFAGPGSAA